MTTTPSPLKVMPGIKRDGTRFDGDFYTDAQWMRIQRGLPRKMGGYRSIVKELTEVSRGFTNYPQQDLVYCHSGGESTLERFILDSSKISSIVSDRTPPLTYATGTVTLTGGAAGSVNSITVNGVNIMSGSVPFTTSLNNTASLVATNINAFGSAPNYSAVAVGPVITITPALAGTGPNGYVVAASTTTITTTTANMSGGLDGIYPSTNNIWMFDYAYDASALGTQIIAHVAPNGSFSNNDQGGQIFIGDAFATSVLDPVALPSGGNATGGIVMLHPYLFYYGTGGVIGWSVAGSPSDLSGSGSGIARPWGQKIIKGLPLRAGAGAAPAGLFWAYDAVIRASFTGGSTVFQFDTIASNTSIMSADSVVDYDGIFFWAGVDRFLMFNGVVREVPNQLNLNWFFDGLNDQQRTKVFAFTITRYGEIWWCYPRGDATECTHAVIFNVRENTWYDTILPESGRTAGGFCNSYAAPILASHVTGNKVWIHEQGVDEVDGSEINAVKSYFETCDISAAARGINSKLRITMIEPDFVQTGDMVVQVAGRANARAPEVVSREFTFPDTATTPHEEIVVLKEQRRELRLRFTSNTISGDYQMGQILIHTGPGDGTVLG